MKSFRKTTASPTLINKILIHFNKVQPIFQQQIVCCCVVFPHVATLPLVQETGYIIVHCMSNYYGLYPWTIVILLLENQKQENTGKRSLYNVYRALRRPSITFNLQIHKVFLTLIYFL